MAEHLVEAVAAWFADDLEGGSWLRDQQAYGRDEIAARDVVSELIDLAYFASLRTDEQRSVRLSIVWMDGGASELAQEPSQREGFRDPDWLVTPFEPIPISNAVEVLAKLAVLAEFGRDVLVCGGPPGGLRLDGLASKRPGSICGREIVVSAANTGTVTVIDGLYEAFRYEAGQRVPPSPPVFDDGYVSNALWTILDPRVQRQLDDPSERSADEQGIVMSREVETAFETVEALVRGVTLLRHGGLLLFANAASAERRRSSPTFTLKNPNELARAARESGEARVALYTWPQRSVRILKTLGSDEGDELVRSENDELYDRSTAAQSQLAEMVRRVARLSALDNALLFGPGLEVLGAGYPVPSSPALPQVREALDVMGEATRPYDLANHGSRHRAAASFANDNPGSLAFVVSADGPVKCFLRVEERLLFWSLRFADV